MRSVDPRPNSSDRYVKRSPASRSTRSLMPLGCPEPSPATSAPGNKFPTSATGQDWRRSLVCPTPSQEAPQLRSSMTVDKSVTPSPEL
jgi:hypothetical protein